MKIKGLSDLVRAIKNYEAKNNFKPRSIELSFEEFRSVADELDLICRYKTSFDFHSDKMEVAAVPVVHTSQVLKLL